jgi:ribosome-associated protein
MRTNMKNVIIQTEYVTLGQLLKMTDCISSGGLAKLYLIENPTFVNGEIESRRGRKLYRDDQININGVGEFVIK